MVKYYKIFLNLRFGLVGSISYIYYLLFELLSPVVEIFGILTMLIAWHFNMLNAQFMLKFLFIYSVYGAVLTITAFYQRIYTQNLTIRASDGVKAIYMCLLENLFFRYILSFVRITSLIGYKKKKSQWGTIKRVQQKYQE